MQQTLVGGVSQDDIHSVINAGGDAHRGPNSIDIAPAAPPTADTVRPRHAACTRKKSATE